eukprot:gnl/MRDRNA2_/MRDRNA2_27063_c0_seq1.p1 gnl/MRDRNA2_/MRDRNA2_27063_c0~~gnl/MRDRNA2_/MRDRNA2_27063_c0_seq1.p1  ORF type:complete len:319 (-),score=41.80 gnl/MRDRNA2_/MRDRNA2_27063_c0_seq1:596-1468(-)
MCAMHIVLCNWASCATASANKLATKLGCSKRCKCPSTNSQVAIRSSLSSSQQQEEPLLLLSRLPEALQLQVLSMSSVKDCLSVALTNRMSYHEIWENSRLWHSLLIGLDAQRQDLGNLSALQLQDKFRWEHFGIDLLAAGKELVAENKRAVLQKAERAVRAMLPRDVTVAEPVTKALSGIIENASEQSGRAVPEEHCKALISVVTSQIEVFTMEQTLDLVSVHHQLIARSQPCRRMCNKTRFPRNQSGGRGTPDFVAPRKQKPVQPPAAFNDEVYGRLSFLMSDVVSMTI